MNHNMQFYIDGKWVDPVTPRSIDVINPSNESVITQVSLGSKADVDKAVAAAKRAFVTYSQTPLKDRIALLERIVTIFKRRSPEIAEALSKEMGAPMPFALESQAASGDAHLEKLIKVLKEYPFDKLKGTTLVTREPIGVVGLITPWNWPLNQIACKVGPALAAGCTMILKPSEIAPLNCIIFAEVLDEAGVPAGVFNLINGDGPSVGHAMSTHSGIDMMSFTGSTKAGIQVAKDSADTVKRVSQELGGKSANILFPDVDFKKAVIKGVNGCFGNSGQSCNAPTRMFVPRDRMDEAAEYAKMASEKFVVGPADAPTTNMGPVVSQVQYDKIQALIESGIKEGATLVTGGLGRPSGYNHGYFVRPTVFANVTHSMRISKEEIFGPVLSILAYDSIDSAIEMANDSEFGLAAYVQSADLEKARNAARRLRAGCVHINYPAWDDGIPFGGYKQSGNGREYAEYGLEEFLETKGIAGYNAA